METGPEKVIDVNAFDTDCLKKWGAAMAIADEKTREALMFYETHGFDDSEQGQYFSVLAESLIEALSTLSGLKKS